VLGSRVCLSRLLSLELARGGFFSFQRKRRSREILSRRYLGGGTRPFEFLIPDVPPPPSADGIQQLQKPFHFRPIQAHPSLLPPPPTSRAFFQRSSPSSLCAYGSCSPIVVDGVPGRTLRLLFGMRLSLGILLSELHPAEGRFRRGRCYADLDRPSLFCWQNQN